MFLEYIKEVFTYLIMVSCIGSCSILIEDIILQGMKPKEGSFFRKEIKFPIFGNVSIASIIGTLGGIAITISWYLTKNWILNNILGLVLATTFLKTIKLSKLMPGVVLLSLLFFYDIFWVFISPAFTGGTSVMVAVATSLEVPIKLYMPHIT